MDTQMLREAVRAAANKCKDDELLNLVMTLLIRSNARQGGRYE